MQRVNVVLGAVCVFLGSLVVGCGASGQAQAPASTWTAAAAPAPKAETGDRDLLWIGPSRGEMDQPELHRWQTALLQAVGRDGQYGLFEYVIIESGGTQNVYVGLRYEPLELTPQQIERATAVQASYAGGPVGATARNTIWMAHAWVEAAPDVAAAN